MSCDFEDNPLEEVSDGSFRIENRRDPFDIDMSDVDPTSTVARHDAREMRAHPREVRATRGGVGIQDEKSEAP